METTSRPWVCTHRAQDRKGHHQLRRTRPSEGVLALAETEKLCFSPGRKSRIQAEARVLGSKVGGWWGRDADSESGLTFT